MRAVEREPAPGAVRKFNLFNRLYDPLIELPENLGLRRLRRQTLRGLRGRVLELGVGTGRNLPLYPATVERLSSIDPDEIMLSQAERRARKATSWMSSRYG